MQWNLLAGFGGVAMRLLGRMRVGRRRDILLVWGL